MLNTQYRLHTVFTITVRSVGLLRVWLSSFLPRDASAERGYKIACRPSVCP